MFKLKLLLGMRAPGASGSECINFLCISVSIGLIYQNCFGLHKVLYTIIKKFVILYCKVLCIEVEAQGFIELSITTVTIFSIIVPGGGACRVLR